MVQKIFTYRGKKLEELQKQSMTETANMMPSNIRRKINRLTDEEKKLLKKIETSKKPVKTHLRNLPIIPSMVGKTLGVYNGKEFVQVIIIEEMIGHRLGEYSLTRNRVAHSAPGVGATRSSANLSVK